jgi:hypoxanthine phosphoribosyltransferase
MEVTKSKVYLSWDEIESLINIISMHVPEEIDSIMGLPRGGLIPAVMLSHQLNLPLVQKVTKNTLIVDDICDSGETFLEIWKLHTFNKFACLHYKPHTSKFTPDIYAVEFTSDDWLVYPWERDDSDAIQDYLK